MARRVTKEFHVTPDTFDSINNIASIKAIPDEVIAALIWFVKVNLAYEQHDIDMMILEYRKYIAEKQQTELSNEAVLST